MTFLFLHKQFSQLLYHSWFPHESGLQTVFLIISQQLILRKNHKLFLFPRVVTVMRSLHFLKPDALEGISRALASFRGHTE